MIQFYTQREDKKLYFNDTEQKVTTGLSMVEFDEMAEFLYPFAGQFQTFDYKEALNILLMHIRQGTNYEFLLILVQKMTGKKMTYDAFSIMVRRCLYILVGQNQEGYEETYHIRFSNKPIYRSVGKYFNTYITLDTSTYDYFRSSGASVLSKALSMTKDELYDLIESCEGGDADDIVEYVESHLYMSDMYVAVDATYVSHSD